MGEYQIVTDSSSDLPLNVLEQEDIISMPLSFTIDGKQYHSGEMPASEFYQKMRQGAMPITSQVNVEEATNAFRAILDKGKDILYIAFSSAMSGTYNSACLAAEELRKEYSDREIVIVDSKSVCLGQGLLTFLTSKQKQAGASLKQATEWAQGKVKHIIHMVTASELTHLYRGGRISKTANMIGSLLNIQPIISLNDAGVPEVIEKKRGHKNALNAMITLLQESIGSMKNQICCIAHTDCEPDALYLKEKIEDVFDIHEFIIAEAGPVLGAHTGPGASAVFLLGDHRFA